MGVHVGTWVYSDTLKALDIAIKKADGTAFDLTNYAAGIAVQVKSMSGSAVLATITGSVVGTATLGNARVYLGATAALQPATADAVVQYRGMVKLTYGTDATFAGKGEDGGEPFTFSVFRWVP